MAILICPECGGNVSTMAAFCPHCGITMENIEKEIQRKSVLVIPDETEYYDVNLIDTTYLKKIILPIELENINQVSQKVGYNVPLEYYGQNAIEDIKLLDIPFDIVCQRQAYDGDTLFKYHKQTAIENIRHSDGFNIDYRWHYYVIGRFYLDGYGFGFEKLSIRKNIQKAVYWLKLAAYKCAPHPYIEGEELPPPGFYGYPHPEACYILGSTYAKGIDVERDFELAEYYLSLGAEVGVTEWLISEETVQMAELCSNLLKFLHMDERNTEWYLWNAIFGIYDVGD